MKIHFMTTLFCALFFVSSAFAGFVESIQGKVEKSDSGQIFIKTEKSRYLLVGDFTEPENPQKTSLTEMAGKYVIVTGVFVRGSEGVRSLKVSTVSELAHPDSPGFMRWPSAK